MFLPYACTPLERTKVSHEKSKTENSENLFYIPFYPCQRDFMQIPKFTILDICITNMQQLDTVPNFGECIWLLENS